VIEVRDDAGGALVLAGHPERIVSLVPSLTEAVCRLGGAERLVGVTRYCTEPSAVVRRVTKVGGTKNPDLEQIRSLAPDLVIVNVEENRREDFEALQAAGLSVFVSFPRCVRDVGPLMERFGALLGAPEAGQALSAELWRALADCKAGGRLPRARVFCPIWRNPWMSFNRDTYLDDILRVVGGDNVCAAEVQRYCSVDLEAVAVACPDVILLPDEPYAFKQKDLVWLAPLAQTPAMRHGRVRFIDGKALSWYGPRTAAALRYLREQIAATS